MGERGVTYSLKFQARCISAVKGSNKTSRWLVGTNSLREDNEVQLLEYDSERNSISQVASYSHEHEVWDIVPSPNDASQLITVRSKGGTRSAILWRMGTSNCALQQVTELAGHAGPVRRVAWSDHSPDSLVSLEDSAIKTWKLQDGRATVTAESPAGDMTHLCSGCWDPHNPNSFMTTGANNLQVWDLRSLRAVTELQSAHSAPVRDVDAARQQEHLVVTAGDDAKVRHWDLRQGSSAKPLAEAGPHRHWVWQARFSPSHSQLTLSCSSDALVNLMYTPGLVAGPGPQRSGAPSSQDTISKAFDDHEESVYGVAWSASDPWVFASLSYDGRVVVNRVPGQIKYKILI